MTVFRYMRILPLLVLVALMSFAVRMGEFVTGLNSAGVAFAQQEVDASMPPLPPPGSDAAEAESIPLPSTSGVPPIDLPKVPVEGAAETPSAAWRDSSDTEFEYSDVQPEIYKDLAARRADIEKRTRELAIREALLEAGQRELDSKLAELTALRNEIQSLLEQQSTEEQARIASLVKIYEGMKAKDAAVIFNTLEMEVLLRILSQMSERKSAPILAVMNPERARNVTILLAEQKQLPTLVP